MPWDSWSFKGFISGPRQGTHTTRLHTGSYGSQLHWESTSHIGSEMTCLHYFFYYFLKRHLPKILGNILIMSNYWYFWKPSAHVREESGVSTMLVVLSLPFIIIPFIYLLFKKCHLLRKIAAINQLIKIDSSSINYSRENEIILTY